MINRVRLARLLFCIDAVMGVLAIGGAALFGAAYAPGDVWQPFLTVFIPGSLLWSSICYMAYRGLTGGNLFLRSVFWVYVVCNLPIFPIGTAIAGVSIWLWRELKRHPAPGSA